MAVTKTIEIDGIPVTFRASAAIPRLYRNQFHRDIYKDLSVLEKSIDKSEKKMAPSIHSVWNFLRILPG
jgi:hypothetical protein